MTWCLYALAREPAVQNRLRAELRALPPPSSSSQVCAEEALHRCEYLEWVVRETLRVHTPVTATMRTVGRAWDAIPLSGGAREVPVRRGDIITVPIAALNRSVDVWGPDAAAFRPDRWANVPESARAVPGLWANMMTFLGGGGPGNPGRSCIGWKFALAE